MRLRGNPECGVAGARELARGMRRDAGQAAAEGRELDPADDPEIEPEAEPECDVPVGPQGEIADESERELRLELGVDYWTKPPRDF